MAKQGYLVSVDLGAGQGAKIGLFTSPDRLLRENLLPTKRYGNTAEQLADGLVEHIAFLCASQGATMKDVRGIGVASPGLFRSDGSYLLIANIPFLNGRNLRQLLEERTGAPVRIDNDANAGGLAEWSAFRVELLYWVFGGGWGGAWISRDGEVRHPAVDWDGNDSSLHYTNEPGYAIPIEKMIIRSVLTLEGVPYERLERVLLDEFQPQDGVLRGPSGSADHLRAETLLSGPGRGRLFRAVVGENDFYERFLSAEEVAEMKDPAVAGKHISKLSAMRVEPAVITDRLFGRLLAHASRIMFRQGRKDGLPENIPICLGGKPSYALIFFGPSCQRALGPRGILSYLRPSIIDERGSNANLVGAAVLAEKAAKTSAEG